MCKQWLLILADVNHNEEAAQHIEITVRTDVRHPPDVTQSHPTQGACSEEGMQAELTTANGTTSQQSQQQYGCGQGVKRMRFTEQEPTVTASASTSRNMENNGMY